MSNVLKEMLDQRVSVLTSDGRRMLGKLRAVDHLANLVLENSTERIYSLDSEMEEVALGLYILRGENVAVVGVLEAEDDLEMNKIRAGPLPPITHGA